MQQYIAAKRISFPANGRHNETCINHMVKITPNCSHAFDDICDTLYDAICIALIEKTIYNIDMRQESQKKILSNMNHGLRKRIRASEARNAG
jgi:hypothetical protein